MARAELDDLKKIRKAHGGTVNDVLLTVVTGALREWLLSRGEPVVAGTSVRALVPVSMQDDGRGRRATGCRPTWSTCRSASRTRACG